MLMRWFFVFLLTTGVALAQSQQPSPRSGESSQPPQAQSDGNQRQAPADTRGTEENPFVVRRVTSKEEAATDATDHQQKATTERWNIIIGCAAVSGAFLQAFIFFVMLSTSRRQLRAYVFVETKEDDQPLINGARGSGDEKGTIIPLHIVNRGQTPAYRVHFWITTNVLADPFPFKGSPTPTRKPSFTYIDLGPNQPIPIFGIMDRAWTQAEMAMLLGQKGQIYVWGTVFYRDAFTRYPWCRWRRTEFRLMIPVQPDGGVHGIMFCEKGNKAT
jgi:hypothetical protein